MLALSIHLATAIRGYLAIHMPTNRMIDWLSTSRGQVWAVPIAFLATPAYLFAMRLCATVDDRGGPGWVNLLALLFAWNAMKFAAMGAISLWIRLWRRATSGRAASRAVARLRTCVPAAVASGESSRSDR